MKNSFSYSRWALVMCFLWAFTAQVWSADASSEIRMKTAAAVGTKLRIQLDLLSNATISGGVEKGQYYGEYTVVDPSKDIVISGNVEQLECYGCQLTSLDVTKDPYLQILRCYNNQLTQLDLTANANLNTLDCNSNKLSSLDVSGNAKMERLNCSNNALTSLTFGEGNVLVSRVECGHNQLSTLNLEHLVALTDLYAENNQLPTLDFSHNTKVNWLKVQGNKIDTGMTDMIASLPSISSQALIYIVDTRNADEANKCYIKHVVAAGQRGWITCDWAGGLDTGDMTGVFYYGCDYEPNYGNRTITLSTGKMMGETITLDIASGGHDVTIDGVAESAPFVGKQTFTLMKPFIVIKGDVTKLTCSGNDISIIDFGGDAPVLTDFDCSNNNLVSLELENLTSLTTLKCQQNNLEKLTVSGCTALQRIDCYRNSLKGVYMSMFIKSLPEVKNNPYLFLIDTNAPNATPELNTCTTDDAAAAQAKGWKLKDYFNGGNYGFGKDFGGEDATLPEQYFEFSRDEAGVVSFVVEMNRSADVPVLKGAEISSWNGSGLMLKMIEPTARIYGDVKKLTVIYSGLTMLDVSHLTNLTDLNCGLNNLTSLDVSNNSKLALLSCEINKLRSINISGTNLDFLNCYGNHITGENMTALVNSLPNRTNTSEGVFIVVDNNFFDEAGLSQEHNVCTTNNVSEANEKNWKVYDLNGGVETMKPYEGVDPAGIEEIKPSTIMKHDVLYNLNGQRVKTPMGHGIFIRNGKKVMY